MKILKIKNGIEYKMPYDFNVRGLGVLYLDATYKGRSHSSLALCGGDAFDLKLGDNYIITNTPLRFIDRIGKIGEGPLGFKYTWPVIYKKGEKLEFSCKNTSIDQDDIYLLLYGLPFSSREAMMNKIQRKPDRIIKLHSFFFPCDGSATGQEMGFDKTIHLLSLGLVYAEKLAGLAGVRYQNMPDSIKGYFQVVGHLYNFFEDQTRALNIFSDMQIGYKAETKYFNAKKITIPENDLLTLQLEDALTYHSSVTTGDQNLWTTVEYCDHWRIKRPTKRILRRR